MESIAYQVKETEPSKIEVSVVVAAKEAQEAYPSVCQKVAAKVKIKGFRPGKVPVAVLQRHYGGLLDDELMQLLLSKAYPVILEKVDQKPLSFFKPYIKEQQLSSPRQEDGTFADLHFTLCYETMPKIVLPKDYKAFHLSEKKVRITGKDVSQELEKLQRDQAIIRDKAADSVVVKGDIVTVDYSELDEKGQENTSSKREDFTFTAGETPTYYQFENDVLSLKRGEEKILEKNFPQNYAHKELRGKTAQVKIFLKTLKEQELPPLNDDFAQKLDEKYTELSVLKQEIQNQLEQHKEVLIQDCYYQEYLGQVVKKIQTQVPRSLLDAELEFQWGNLAKRYGIEATQFEQAISASGETSKEKLLLAWEEGVKQNILKRLVYSQILKEEGIVLSKEARQNFLEQQAKLYKLEPEALEKQLKEQHSEAGFEEQALQYVFVEFLKKNLQFNASQEQDYADFIRDRRSV